MLPEERGLTLVSVLIGAALGALFVLFVRTRNRRRELTTYGVGVIVCAVIYVVFAILRHGLPHLPLEILGLAAFSVAAMVGLRGWPAVIGLAWIAHGAWDVVLHSPPQPYVPSWYPIWCLGFDWVVGVYILASRKVLGDLK